MQIHFNVYVKPEPQGSMKGHVLPARGDRKARAVLTSSNPKMKPYRDEVTRRAMIELADRNFPLPMAGKHVPVGVVYEFHLLKPASVSKRRTRMVVKPDIDKLVRSTNDALTGILYVDDAQIVDVSARKHYGTIERVEISVTVLQ